MESVKLNTVQAISYFMQKPFAKELHKAGIYLSTLLYKEQYSLEEVGRIAREEYKRRTGRELFDQFYPLPQTLQEEPRTPIVQSTEKLEFDFSFTSTSLDDIEQLIARTIEEDEEKYQGLSKQEKKRRKRQQEKERIDRFNFLMRLLKKRKEELLSQPAVVSELSLKYAQVTKELREETGNPLFITTDDRGNVIELDEEGKLIDGPRITQKEWLERHGIISEGLMEIFDRAMSSR